jgi:hypothetical protein
MRVSATHFLTLLPLTDHHLRFYHCVIKKHDVYSFHHLSQQLCERSDPAAAY